MKSKYLFSLVAAGVLLASCGSDDPQVEPPVNPVDNADLLFVVNGGNYSYSNASISVVSGLFGDETPTVDNEAFFKSNGFKLGDVAQSMTIVDEENAWIVVNNSNVIFHVDPLTMKEKGRIDNGISSPRYFLQISDDKAYVSQMYTNQIAIVNPKTCEVTGHVDIPVPDGSMSAGGTEDLVLIGDYVFSNLWNYDNRIVKIDTETDKVIIDCEVGLQPYSLVKDCKDRLWTICDGGWYGHPIDYVAPQLVCIDPVTMKVVKNYTMQLGDMVSKLCLNGEETDIYWICNRWDQKGVNVGGVYVMDIDQPALPEEPFIASKGGFYYSMTVSPDNGDIFVADPIDYTQAGLISQFSKTAGFKQSFTVGIIPTSYAWLSR